MKHELVEWTLKLTSTWRQRYQKTTFLIGDLKPERIGKPEKGMVSRIVLEVHSITRSIEFNLCKFFFSRPNGQCACYSAIPSYLHDDLANVASSFQLLLGQDDAVL